MKDGTPDAHSDETEERALRSQQRQMLRQLLTEGEQRVPSTTAQILLAISQEQKIPQEELARSNGHAAPLEIETLSTQPLAGARPPVTRERHPRRLLHTVLTLVAVLAISLVSVGVFSRMIPLHSSSSSSSGSMTGMQKHAPGAVVPSPDWSSVVMTELRDGQKIIVDTDPISGKSAMLASSPYLDSTAIDGVSHDGYKVLYHIFDGTSTRYYIQPSSESNALYMLNGKGSQAIWSTDDHSVFISTADGIGKIDTLNRTATLALSSPRAADLRFYRDGYLYFAQSQNNGTATALSRVNLANGSVIPVTIGLCALSYGFWLSPGGTTVYYRCKEHPDLYAANSDGINARSLRANVGEVIGYAAQGELLTLIKTGSTYKIMKLGSDVQHDQVVFADAAPGAFQLTSDDVAVMPYGQSLVALAYYADGSSKIWYDDLVTNTQRTVLANIDTQSAANMQFGGWSKLQVA